MVNGGLSARRGGNGHIDATKECHELTDAPDAARTGRHFVQQRLQLLGADDVIDDAALVAAELLANAVQHGERPIRVCVRRTAASVRVEVHDASPRSPIRPTASLTNMTGRGLTLVDALSAHWGVQREPGNGKSVWADLVADPAASRSVDEQVDSILAQWDDDHPAAEERYMVVLGDVPTDLLLEAKGHIDNLVREFSLAATARESGDVVVPEHLARLIETVVHGFADARAAIKRQALAAAQRGDPRTSLTLHLPVTAADAGEAYLAALDEADGYARAARLLTLETPPDHRLFRRWYVEALIAQLRSLARGEQQGRVLGFEETLVAEVRRLYSVQRVSDRAARLQRVTAALARTRTPEDVALVVVTEGVAALEASGGGLLVPAGDGEHLSVPGAVGYGEELVGQLRAERIDAPLPAATALRTAEPVWLETQDERDRLFPELRGFESTTVAMCAVPLMVGDHAIGALRFSFTARKLFDDDERSFVLALATITAQTLQRTETYEAEREAALELQRALLPQDIPSIPGWDVAAYYSPAGEQEAGGDFYDVIPVAGGRIAAIVGDVMGRGVQAAAAMAQVRSTMRAYAIDDPDPVRVFGRVDAFFAALDTNQLVTALYFLVDADHNTVHIGNAGHLAPLVVDRDGSRVVEIAGGLPFGVREDLREVASVTVPPGTALIAFTDGLVERRGEDIDEGIARLVAATRTTNGWTAQELLDHIVRSASAEGLHDDDVTVVVLRRR